jgi:hypothetical protein
MVRVLISSSFFLMAIPPAFSQGRGGSNWSTTGNDAQRSSWVRTDPKISAASMQKPGFQFMWKLKLGPHPLTQPVLMDRYIGYRGFRSYAFIADSANNTFTMDSDLSRVEWKKTIPTPPANSSTGCPGGMTASVTERLSSAFPSTNMGQGGFGRRGGPAKSAVGLPGEGAITIPAVAPTPAPARGPAPAAGGPPNRGRMPSYLTALSSDGALHNMYVSNGEEPGAGLSFLPANANATGFIVVDDVAYAVTSGGCGGAPDGVWALDLESKDVANWKGKAVATAFGPDGFVYVTTVAGDLVALESKTLVKKNSYSAGQRLASTPLVFEQNGKAMVAAAAADGSIHVVDGKTLSKVALSAPAESRGSAFASWQDAAGTRWILNGNTAWKMGDGGLQKGWSAADVKSTVSVAVVNGVVFLASSGNSSAHAMLYALDAATGRERWNSGNTINSFIASGGGLAAGGSAIYIGTDDGTLWAFGYPIEH